MSKNKYISIFLHQMEAVVFSILQYFCNTLVNELFMNCLLHVRCLLLHSLVEPYEQTDMSLLLHQ